MLVFQDKIYKLGLWVCLYIGKIFIDYQALGESDITMKISQIGVDLIKRFEGLELESYQDIAGIWTIGYGHTGPEVEAGQKLSPAEAEALLRHDLISREKAVSRLTNVPLNQNEFDALVSFVYNVGATAYSESTARRRLNKENREGAGDALTWFNKARINGVLRPVAGLTRRRAAERDLFLTPTEAVSQRSENIDDNSRISAVEDPPRRGSFGDSRTVQGAAVAGGAGVAASNMGQDASAELDSIETNIENGTGMTETPSSMSTTTVTNGESSDNASSDNSSSDNSNNENENTDSENTDSPDDMGTMIELPHRPAKHDVHDADAQIQFALMIIIVLAVLYILYARFDDWLKFRR